MPTNLYFTGVGSRSTPPYVLTTMTKLAYQLAAKGYILRSGAADGADHAFELGYINNYTERGLSTLPEIYLPWPKFNNHPSSLWLSSFHITLQREALDIARSIVKHWHNCSIPAKRLHTRNIFQVLGKDLRTPSQFVMCWTPNGKDVGGTRTAIVLAKQRGIEVINLGAKTKR